MMQARRSQIDISPSFTPAAIARYDVTEPAEKDTIVRSWVGEGVVPRYFFSIRWADHEDDDQHGTQLPDDAGALDHANRIIRELKEGGGCNDPELMMVVRNETHKTVLSLPFLAGCA